jgi:hypothetical protein
MASGFLDIPGESFAWAGLSCSHSYVLTGSANWALAALPGSGLGARLGSVQALDSVGLGGHPGELPGAEDCSCAKGHFGSMRSFTLALQGPHCPGSLNTEAIWQCFLSNCTPSIQRAQPVLMQGNPGIMAKQNGPTQLNGSIYIQCAPSLAGDQRLNLKTTLLKKRGLMLAMGDAGEEQHTVVLSYTMPATVGHGVVQMGLLLLL